MGLDVDGSADFAAPKNLHERALGHEALGQQLVRRDVSAIEVVERVEIDRLVLDAERVVEAAQFRDPLVEGHLTTLEPHRNRVACALALATATGGLAAGATDTATLALLLRC